MNSEESRTHEETATKRPPVLLGLVLAGGRSRRMGRDKAALAYRDGVPHARRTAELLGAVCERVFVSRRADQSPDDPVLAGLDTIPDAFDAGGPLNGILSALAARPDAAFLVAACDLPFLDEAALKALVAGRDPARPLTVFANPARDGALEPLCAIYEPSYTEGARFAMDRGMTCPTKIADALNARVLTLAGADDARFLENANRPEDYERAVARLGGAAPETITVEYFAVFRAQAKRSSEDVAADGASLAALYDRLRERHGFALGRASVHVAVNDAWSSWDAVPRPGDRVVFIPPVSGG